jgi:hypothetical protein
MHVRTMRLRMHRRGQPDGVSPLVPAGDVHLLTACSCWLSTMGP